MTPEVPLPVAPKDCVNVRCVVKASLSAIVVLEAIILPVNVAPLALIPLVNLLISVNVFATFVAAPSPARPAVIVYVNPVLALPDCAIVTLDPALIPTAPVFPLNEATMFGAVMLPVNVAPVALIPAANVLSPVNVFAPKLAPATAPVFPLKEATMFGAVILPVNVAPLALIPALNVLSRVNVFATEVVTPPTAPVFPLNEATLFFFNAQESAPVPPSALAFDAVPVKGPTNPDAVCVPVNVFAPRLAPATAPVFPLKLKTPKLEIVTAPVAAESEIPAPAIAPETPPIFPVIPL